ILCILRSDDLITIYIFLVVLFFFFFQAEDGIRDRNVTGVQTCALPICSGKPRLQALYKHPSQYGDGNPCTFRYLPLHGKSMTESLFRYYRNQPTAHPSNQMTAANAHNLPYQNSRRYHTSPHAPQSHTNFRDKNHNQYQARAELVLTKCVHQAHAHESLRLHSKSDPSQQALQISQKQTHLNYQPSPKSPDNSAHEYSQQPHLYFPQPQPNERPIYSRIFEPT